MKLLTIDAVTFNHTPEQLHVFLGSLAVQTDKRFHCNLWHDGPAPTHVREVANIYINKFPELFTFKETPDRLGKWGHNLRSMGLMGCQTKYWKSDNADNYVMPRMVEFCLDVAEGINLDLLLYPICHSYPGVNGRNDAPYSVLEVAPCLNRFDASSFIVRTDRAKEVGWGQEHSHEDGIFVNMLMRLDNIRWDKLQSIMGVHN